MDTFLAIASKRDTRRYADRAVPEEVERRILEAGGAVVRSRPRVAVTFTTAPGIQCFVWVG